MPQWSRDRDPDRRKYPDERWTALCPRAEAPQLLRYDHHVVWIKGRPALLLTYRWAGDPLDTGPAELPFEVSFTYAQGHPPAPRAIQRLVDTLSFTPVKDDPGESAG